MALEAEEEAERSAEVGGVAARGEVRVEEVVLGTGEVEVGVGFGA